MYSPVFANYRLVDNPDVNIRDKRSFGEQALSGFRLAGWVLLTLAFIYAQLFCADCVLNRTAGRSHAVRVLGATGLVAISVLMFISAKYWAKWFAGALGYYALKAAFTLRFRYDRLLMQLLLLLVAASVLCARCLLKHSLTSVEKAGLVALAVSLSFSLVLDSALPFLIGVSILAVVQFAGLPFRSEVGAEVDDTR